MAAVALANGLNANVLRPWAMNTKHRRTLNWRGRLLSLVLRRSLYPMIRIDAIWLSTTPLDMGAGIYAALGTLEFMVVALESLPALNAKQLRELSRDLIAQIARNDQKISQRNIQISERDQQIANLDQTISSEDPGILYRRQAKIDQHTHEM